MGWAGVTYVLPSILVLTSCVVGDQDFSHRIKKSPNLTIVLSATTTPILLLVISMKNIDLK